MIDAKKTVDATCGAALAFLRARGRDATAIHVENVARRAAGIAERFGEDPARAETAGILHDISAVIPSAEMVAAADGYGLAVCAEERALPMLLHQRLSREMAKRDFGVSDAGILAAIECHTTLRPSPTRLDMILFVADKLAWDQAGAPPFAAAVEEGLATSLEAASLGYIDFALRAGVKVAHPWLLAAREWLEKAVEGSELDADGRFAAMAIRGDVK